MGNLGLSPSFSLTGCVALANSFTTYVLRIYFKSSTIANSGYRTKSKRVTTELTRENTMYPNN